MKLAYVKSEGRGITDAFLAEVAQRLSRDGVRLAGTVQFNRDRSDRSKCDMDLKILSDGPLLRISEDRGAAAKGCVISSGALEQAVMEVERRLEGANLLIINKFGKREAEGRGLRPIIAEAFAQGIPVLVGVNALNNDAFIEFSGGMAEALPPNLGLVLEWAATTLRIRNAFLPAYTPI